MVQIKIIQKSEISFFPQDSIFEESEKKQRKKRKQLSKSPNTPEDWACRVFGTSFSVFIMSMKRIVFVFFCFMTQQCE